MIPLYNQSVHVFDQSSINEYLRCTELSNSLDRNVSNILWYSPTGQRLNVTMRSISDSDETSQCHYSELELSNSSSNGIYSCEIVRGTSTLHRLYIGVYDHPRKSL